MARFQVPQVAGTLIHLTQRGIRREAIFRNDEDRQDLLRLLGSVVLRHQWQCLAYCLMDNHFHLCVRTPDSNLSRGMQFLCGLYAQRFNQRHSLVGHLFQGRYKGFVVEDQRHALEVLRYVVLNPVRAGMVGHPDEWPWSSHGAVSGLVPVPRWLDANAILGQFNGGVEEYRRFIQVGVSGRPLDWRGIGRMV